MPQPPRVFITGVGLISPMGNSLPEHIASMRSGDSYFRKIDFFDVSRQRVTTAGVVDLPDSLGEHSLSEKEVKRLDRGSLLMLYATGKALASAQLSAGDPALPANTPMVIGTSAGAMPLGEAYFKAAQVKAPKVKATQEAGTIQADDHGAHEVVSDRGQISRVEHYQAQKGMAMIQRAFGFRAQSQIISNACASGANAIGHAFHQLKSGKRELALAGGYDAISEMVFSGFNALQALSESGIPRPFDAERDGLALGEGAAMLVLETEASMLARGATPVAEIIGYGMATDLHHLTQPHPEGKAAVASMTAACRDAGVTPSDIQYINSHGTGTPLNDVAEANAICTWCANEGDGKSTNKTTNQSTKRMMVSSTKSAMGHALGGAGAIESAICLLALQEQFVPGSLNVRKVDPACRFDLVQSPREARLDTVLTNSFGFGGCNASLIFKRCATESAAESAREFKRG